MNKVVEGFFVFKFQRNNGSKTWHDKKLMLILEGEKEKCVLSLRQQQCQFFSQWHVNSAL
jgi:hypothetical protein